MAERSGFFPYVEGDSNSEYTSDWLAKYISSIISNGVYNGELGVTADGSNMAVTLPSGRAWINGYHYRNDGNLTLPIDNADGVLNRIDVIVLRWDINARSITAQVIKGTPASNAVAPAITRTVEQYDLKLAEINVPAGTTAITQSLITDCRLDKSVCGIVTGVVDQVDTTTFYNQIADDLARFRTVNENEFTEWFNSIKDILNDDAVGNLLNMINAHISNTNNPHQTTAEQVGAVSKTGGTMTGNLKIQKNVPAINLQTPSGNSQTYISNNATDDADYGALIEHTDPNGNKTGININSNSFTYTYAPSGGSAKNYNVITEKNIGSQTVADTTSIASAITRSTSDPSTVGANGTLWAVTT